MGEREQRVAANETVFRRANEALVGDFRELGVEPGEFAVFICECGNPRCTQVMRLRLDEYEAVRADANTFALVPGHEDDPTEIVVTAEIVDRNDRFAVVRKRVENRVVTERTDLR